MMVAPRARRPFDGADFDRIARWATDHLVQLVHEVYPQWGRGQRDHLRGPCFLHGGTNPNLDVRNGRGWMCHSGCGTGGDGVDLWRRLWFNGADEKAGRLAALRDLAPRAGVSLEAPRRNVFVPRATPRPLPPPAPVVVVDPLAAPLAALRDLGIIPAEPSTVYAAVLDALPRTDAGDDVARTRGFDPAALFARGFRHLDGRAGWEALREALAASFLDTEVMAAGFRTADEAPALRLSPWRTPVPALVIPYHHRGDVVAVRFRATTAETPKAGRYRTLTDIDVPVPFNADVLDDVAGHVVHVVEGELNALALVHHGCRAVGLPGASAWRDAWTPALRDARAVVAWFDADDAGTRGKARLAASLASAFGPAWVAARCHDRTLPPQRDANDLHRAGVLPAYLETVPA